MRHPSAQDFLQMPLSPAHHRLARRGTLVVAVLAFLVLLVGTVFRNSAQKQPEPEKSSAEEAPPGSFRPTADQWRSLTIEPVKTAAVSIPL